MGHVNLDPRYLRSRAKLHAAIFALAAEQDPSAITVTSVAVQANVHRSTVYEHADSPEQLLRLAIEAELDEVHAEYDPANSSMGDLVRATLAYMETRTAIFSRMADESGVVIADALSSHYVAKMLEFARVQGTDFIPPISGKLDRDEVQQILLRSVCVAIVKVHGEWLRLPQPRDPDMALELMRLVTPSWCPWTF